MHKKNTYFKTNNFEIEFICIKFIGTFIFKLKN
jgi:hypothetical protein